ncbi:uncharacterized protein wu:fc17b08 isoform X1 [Mugil cephalus]|uniref:uncharacterized protein wu:fc17b08 isoform X1 n=1 Tax=Mugil cephalus TaxID=48193 RepID=UPI001FB5D5CE|nr:uncharacterized protein wu:fc17b08 isoform X1 [Mugil cephalus]
MASLCKRQQCTIDRRGFRQELDSWGHKLIHCVGLESILEGLFGSELVEDLKLFKDFEPIEVSDWSFVENCLFCCLRRDKVKEHLIGLNKEELDDTPKPLLVKDQLTISRLEKQAEEFLNAVLCKKDVPNFSDPHIPVVAREILQRMIRQFAAEYTSKTSSPQDSRSDSQPHSDQSLPTPPLVSGAPSLTSPAASPAAPAHSHNPVLSKLLMADQDAPLDLTIKKPSSEHSEQDGVLDLSIKKNRYSSSSLSVHSPCISPATSMVKGESPDFRVARAKDLQSTSTLEQFMAKLCPHHQRQIVDAIGFLQTEVKALASSKTQKPSKFTSGAQGTACSTAKSTAVTPEKSHPELKFPNQSTPKLEVHDVSCSIPSSGAMRRPPEKAVSLKTSAPALDLRTPGSGGNQVSATPTANPVEADNNRHGDHAPLKMKIMTSNADGKKVSRVLPSRSSQPDALEDRQSNSDASNRAETHSARLSSSVKRHSPAGHTHQARQRHSLLAISSDSARTARKTVRTSSDHRTRDSACRGVADPDLGHCDIVYIDRPITDYIGNQQRSMVPRRNARKSTRGHMYSDEIWELKTVRTLAGRGNCVNPMPALITLVTPKQILSKPEGVPPVDMPFVRPCRETMIQQMPTEESGESLIPGTGDVVEGAASKADVIVETSQTDQCQSKEQSDSPSPLSCTVENKETFMNTDVGQEATVESQMTTGGEENVGQVAFEAEKENEQKSHEDMHGSTEQIVPETVVEPIEHRIEHISIEETDPQLSVVTLNSEPVLQQNSESLVNQGEEEIEEDKMEEMQNEEPQKPLLEPQIHENLEVTEEANTTDSAGQLLVKETEMETSEAVDNVMPPEAVDNVMPPEAVDSVMPLDTEDKIEDDVSSKSLDALLKELPPWRRKKGTRILPAKRLSQAETVIVGYFNGRPISASDRNLRRRASNHTSPSKTPVKLGDNLANNSTDSTIDSTTGNTNLEKLLSETDTLIKIEATPVIQQVTEDSSESPSNPIPEVPSCNKQIKKQKRVLRNSLSPESKRQLRSASQKPFETPATLPISNAVTSVSSEIPSIAPGGYLLEQLPSLPLPHPLPVTESPAITTSEPASEQPQQNTMQDTHELEIKNPPVDTTSENLEKNKAEMQLQTKQKLRSAKVAVDDGKNEKDQLSEVSSPLENLSPVKTELQTQIMPLRGKRVLRKDAEASDVVLQQKPDVASIEDKSANGDDSNPSISDRPTRMPLRSESTKAEMSHQSVTQLPPVDNKKLALRSQTLAAPSTSTLTVATRQTDAASPIRILPERVTKAQVRPPSASSAPVSHSSQIPIITPRHEPPKQTVNKFFETLTGEDSQQLISNLNLKYDKMQKGWVQMDKEGQPTAKYKNKSDRQAAIWKSKRRARKPKSLEHQKYSPVQMLFMKGFNLTSICRWFLESTETKSLVIVKKVNTRLPSETQLCFHSSSGTSVTSQGVFPSLQAERLKKHLKKFAIASPVKSNPKSQKLIAKALELEANLFKGRDRGEFPSTAQTKTYTSAKASAQTESQKSSGKSKNPASARILRKYSNIRGKMQVQQTTVRLKEASKILKTNKMKRLATTKAAAKSNLRPSLKARKSALPVSKRMKESAAKMQRRKMLAGKKSTKHTVQVRAVKAQGSSRTSRGATKKDLPKRYSRRLGSPKMSELHPVDVSKNKADNRKHTEAEKTEVEKLAVNKANSGVDRVDETPQQSLEVKVPTSPDQVLTRSQRKMESAVPLSPRHALGRGKKSMKTQSASPKSVKKAEEPKLRRSGAFSTPAKRKRGASLPRSATKLATKRAQEHLVTPAKRTRTSHSK